MSAAGVMVAGCKNLVNNYESYRSVCMFRL